MTLKYSPQPLGEQLRSLSLDGFMVTETKYASSLSLARHIHECACITLVLKGYYLESFGKHREECKPYSLMLKPAGEDHADQYSQTGAHCLVIEVMPQKLAAIRTFSQTLDQVTHAQDSVLSSLAMRIYKEFKLMDSASALSIEGLLLEILGHTTRQQLRTTSSIAPRWLERARDFLHAHFTESVSFPALAAAVDMHPSYLARMFRKHYRCTMGDYVRRLRIEKAMRDLMGTDKSLAEIALALGFYDQSHFTNSFRSYLGITPAEFRAEMQVGQSGTKPSQIFQD